MTAGCCGCWPRGAGTTVPGCARGTGAGAVGRWAVCEEGHGGNGVLEQAVSNMAASTAETFHGINRTGFCLAEGGEESDDPRFAKRCMVMVVGADGCHAGRRLLRRCYLRASVCSVSVHPVAKGILTGETRSTFKELRDFEMEPLRPRPQRLAQPMPAFLRAAGPAQSRDPIESGPFLRAGDH